MNDWRRQLAQAQLEAYNARNIEAFCKCYHKEVIVRDLQKMEVMAEGMSAFREIYRRKFDSNPELHCELMSRVVLEQSVIDEELVTGNVGQAEPRRVVAIYAFRDQLIDRVWFTR